MTQEEVVEITGVTRRMLDYWVRRGYVRPDVPAPGSGRSRIWSDGEIIIARLMARLVTAGITAGGAAKHARNLAGMGMGADAPARISLLGDGSIWLEVWP